MKKDGAMPSIAETTELERAARPAETEDGPTGLVLPVAPVDTPAGRLVAEQVRAFCLTGIDSAGSLVAPGEGVLPAPLHAMRARSRVRTGEPIVLLHGDGPAVLGFGDWLARAIGACFAGDGAARELRDNAVRIERAARLAAEGPGAPASLGELLIESARRVIAETGLSGTGAGAIERDAGVVAESASPGDAFVALDDSAALRVLVHLARRESGRSLDGLRSRARSLRDRLERLLVADARRGAAHAAEALGAGFGPGDSFDAGALEKVLKRSRGPMGMGEARTRRVEGLIERLDAFLAERRPPPHAVVVDRAHAGLIEGGGDIEVIESDLPCEEAAEHWARQADRRLGVFVALRLAALEVENAFDEGVHAPFAASFRREMLSEDEVLGLPAVIAVESASRIAGADMPNLTRVLLSGRPVRVLVEVEPGGEKPGEPGASRFEAGLFGVGLGAAFVHQSSVALPEHLESGFARAIRGGGPSLHVLATGRCADGSEPAIGRWLHAGAAVDARAHPPFVYDPRGGWSLADRFDFGGNEQPERDWPVHAVACVDAGGIAREQESGFTPADFALLEPGCLGLFRVIPPSCPTGDLAPAAELIDAAWPGDRRIPFVWAAGGDGRLVRLAVSRALVEACRDRLSVWRTLQQFAGVRDVYAERAASEARARAEEASGAAISALRAEHEAAVERVKREEAAQVLDRLARSIMGMDPAGLVAPLRAPAKPAPSPPAVDAASPGAAAVEAAPPPAEEEEGAFDEPFIDSALCTSCNDCINLNRQMFRYNANKQAEIADPDAGPYRDLVAAAEKCPARCIHPGKPRNPSEPGLDELIERAKKFR